MPWGYSLKEVPAAPSHVRLPSSTSQMAEKVMCPCLQAEHHFQKMSEKQKCPPSWSLASGHQQRPRWAFLQRAQAETPTAVRFKVPKEPAEPTVFLHREGRRGWRSEGFLQNRRAKGLRRGQNPRSLTPWLLFPLLWPFARETIC